MRTGRRRKKDTGERKAQYIKTPVDLSFSDLELGNDHNQPSVRYAILLHTPVNETQPRLILTRGAEGALGTKGNFCQI